jgi:hypothetical protein
MYERWIQTLDPQRFALDKVRYVIDQLQQNGQDFIVMVSNTRESNRLHLTPGRPSCFQRYTQLLSSRLRDLSIGSTAGCVHEAG